jgi:PrsW family intramembrane metalloprotease
VFWRGLLSPAGHLAWTGLSATASCWAAQRRWRPQAVLRLGPTFVVAAGLHAVWDLAPRLPVYAGLAAVNPHPARLRRLACSPRRNLARPAAQLPERPTAPQVAPGPLTRAGHVNAYDRLLLIDTGRSPAERASCRYAGVYCLLFLDMQDILSADQQVHDQDVRQTGATPYGDRRKHSLAAYDERVLQDVSVMKVWRSAGLDRDGGSLGPVASPSKCCVQAR